jgi:Secretion system C-terminal sorting domain
MKLKLLLSTSLLFIGAYFAKGQTYGTWQGASQATSYDYSIAEGTLGTTYAAGGIAQSSSSTSSSAGYLASPSSGTARVFTSANGGGGFVINGSTLSITSSISAETLNKFALHSISGTSAVTSIFLKLKVESTPNGGTFVLGFGKSGQSGDDIFANDKQLNVAVSTPDLGIFGAFRFQPGNSQTNGGARYLRTSDGTYRYSDPAFGTSYATFQKNTDLNVEIYCNNTSIPRNYSRGIENYTLPARTYNIFANGNLLTIEQQPGGSLISNISSTELAVNEKIDAIFIAAHNAPANQLIVSVSDIKFGWIPQNVLPVELVSFTHKKITNGVQLNWTTASEKDNAYFEVLRASENGVFKVIDKVNGKGSSNGSSNYQFVDDNPVSGKSYYKLKQVDNNGDSKEYGPIVVNFDLEVSKLTAFLNAESKLLLTYNSLENTNAEVVIVDLNGKKLITQKVQLNKGANQSNVDVSVLPKGLYVVKINSKGNIGAAKFVK